MPKFITNLSFVILFLLFCVNAFAAGSIKFFDYSGKTLGTYSLGIPGNVVGITHDGYYFWAVDSATVYQLFQLPDGTFKTVNKFDPTTQIGSSATLTAIETDGTNLFIAWDGIDVGPPLSIIRGCSVFSKNNEIKYNLTTFATGSIGFSWNDMVFDGRLLWAVRGSGLVNPNQQQLTIIDPYTDKKIHSETFRSAIWGIGFDGWKVWTIVQPGNVAAFRHQFPWVNTALTVVFSAGVTAEALKFRRIIDEDGNVTYDNRTLFVGYN